MFIFILFLILLYKFGPRVKMPFLEKIGPWNQNCQSRKNVLQRQIRICWIQWGCSFFQFSNENTFLSKAEVWCQGFPQCGRGGLEDPPTTQNISLSPSLSPLFCPRNIDFVILMQFLAILSKLPPFHKSTPDRKPSVPRRISLWRIQSWCAQFWLRMPQKSKFGPKIQNC